MQWLCPLLLSRPSCLFLPGGSVLHLFVAAPSVGRGRTDIGGYSQNRSIILVIWLLLNQLPPLTASSSYPLAHTTVLYAGNVDSTRQMKKEEGGLFEGRGRHNMGGRRKNAE